MPRKPRFIIPGVPVHIVQRGHSRDPVFFEDADYSAYLGWLKSGVERYHCEIHAYVLMTNHIHILATPRETESITRMMQYVGRHYVPYINHTYGTTGSIWEGRYKAGLIQDEHYLLTCMRYIELNPVRADMVCSPADYRWSSYSANVQGNPNELITRHAIYLSLGESLDACCSAYKELFEAHVDLQDLNNIRSSLQTGTPLGNDHFKQKIEAKLGMKVGHSKRGRPFKIGDKGL